MELHSCAWQAWRTGAESTTSPPFVRFLHLNAPCLRKILPITNSLVKDCLPIKSNCLLMFCVCMCVCPCWGCPDQIMLPHKSKSFDFERWQITSPDPLTQKYIINNEEERRNRPLFLKWYPPYLSFNRTLMLCESKEDFVCSSLLTDTFSNTTVSQRMQRPGKSAEL